MSNTPPATAVPSGPTWLTPTWKVIISLGLIFHLAAVFIPPTAVIPSDVTGPLRDSLAWYTGPLRLQNGYRFFSPDPPDVSMVVRYEIDLPNGETLEGIFPNKEDYWPRLYYHRHLMLTSRLQSLGYNSRQFGWGNAKPLRNDGSLGAWIVTNRMQAGEFGDVDLIDDSEYDVNPDEVPEPLRSEPPDRLDARRYVESYAHHLMAKYDATRVRLYLLEHGVPPRLMFIEEGVTLDTPQSYRQSLLIDLKK